MYSFNVAHPAKPLCRCRARPRQCAHVVPFLVADAPFAQYERPKGRHLRHILLNGGQTDIPCDIIAVQPYRVHALVVMAGGAADVDVNLF